MEEVILLETMTAVMVRKMTTDMIIICKMTLMIMTKMLLLAAADKFTSMYLNYL